MSAVLWAVVFAWEMLAAAAAPAFAQRRRAEPEVNPQFQDEQRSGGGPVGEAPPAGPVEEPAASEQQDPGLGAVPAARAIRVGAVPAEEAPPPAPTNPLDTRIVVRVKNAPLATFLDTISAQAKVNFIITEGLEEKRITAFLQNVTVREALQILLEIKGLTYQRIGRSNTYVVSRRTSKIAHRITRIYTLNYIPLVPISQKKDFTPGKITGMGEGSGGGSSGGSGGSGGAEKETAELVSVLKVLKTVLTKEYGNIATDARTNSLIITDVPEVFPQVEQILAELDRKAPQVMIEAQIVEINSDRAQDLGLEWGGSTGELATYTGPKRDTTFPLNVPKSLETAHFFDPIGGVISAVGGDKATASDEGDSSGLTQMMFRSNLQTGLLDLTMLKVVLRALVSRAEARFLGKPKILTLNNNAAVIQIAQSQAVSMESTTSGGGTGITSSGTQAERFATGLNLYVVPQVNQEGYITMLVQPSFTNVIESKISSQEVPVFDPTTRAAQTLVRVKNGQTLVLGGLLESKETKAVRKVPFLGYIPLIGWLFTSVSSQRSNTDLVIFITPTIVTD
ncbi:MAG: secretin N-terminal domain-containing protein [Elusimicrobiota bacterium]